MFPEGGTNAGDIHTHGNDEKETIEGETDADNVPSPAGASPMSLPRSAKSE